MDAITEIKSLIEDQGDAWLKFKATNEERFGLLENDISRLVERNARKLFSPATGDTKRLEQFVDTKTGNYVPVLSHGDSLAALSPQYKSGALAGFEQRGATPSMGRLLRGIILGGKAHDAAELAEERKSLSIASDPTGGYTVAGALSGEWIDALRANMVLSQAGVRCIPMETAQLSLAKVVTSPTSSWHAEGATVGTGDPTFGSVNLSSKTITCLVRLSLELAQDSANIEQILQQSITQSMAAAIDSAGLNGVTTNAAAAPGGIFNLANRNSVLAIGAPTSWNYLLDGLYELLADNVPMDQIGAMIGHPKLWRKMAGLKSGIASDLTTLTMPPEVAALPKLWTTAAPFTSGTTCKAVVGNWNDLLMGCRKDITVRVLSEAFMGSNLEVAVLAYARVDFAATRAESFCTMEGITV